MPLYDVARFRALEISQDLGNAEHAHGQHGKINAVREIIESQRETLLAGLKILTDCREQQTEHDHDHGLEDRAAPTRSQARDRAPSDRSTRRVRTGVRAWSAARRWLR